jgi:hypothetical protein
MTEHLIDGPEKFIELIKEIELEGPDIEILKGFCSARKTACCSGPRNEALRGIEAIYKKIIFTKLEGMKEELLRLSRNKGYHSIRFRGAFRINRREMDEYDKLII